MPDKTIYRVVAPPPSKGWAARILGWLESPWVTLPVGIVGGIVGILFYAPVLVFCGLCIVLGFHKEVVAGKSWKVQLPSIVVVTAVTSVGLYGIHKEVQAGFKAENISLSQMIVSGIAKLRPAATQPPPGPVPPPNGGSHQRHPSAELQPRIIPYDLNVLFRVNERIVIQLEWFLHGTDAVHSPKFAGAIYIIKRDQDSYRLNKPSPAMQEAVIERWKSEYGTAVRNRQLVNGPTIFSDTPGVMLITGPVITQEDADGLQMYNHTPDRLLFVIGNVRFSDTTGEHESRVCAWLGAASESFRVLSLRWVGCRNYINQVDLARPLSR